MHKIVTDINEWYTDQLQGSTRQSIALSTDGQNEAWYVVKMKRTRSKDWEITEAFVSASIADLKLRIDTSVPTGFNLTAHPSLIHRSVEKIGDPSIALTLTLPGADPTDFFLDIRELGSKTWLVAIRKEALEPILGRIRGLQLELVGLSCGVLSAWALLPAWEESVTSEFIVSKHFSLNTSPGNPGELTALEKLTIEDSPTDFEMDGHVLYFEHLIASSTILDSQYALVSGKQAIASKNAQPYNLLLMSILLLIVIGGTVCSNRTKSSIIALQAQVRANRSFGEIQEQESKKYEASREQYENLGLGDEQNAAYYLDRCASLIDGLSIRELHFAPGIADTYPRFYQRNTMVIEGATSKQSDVSQLISKLESSKWVEEVKLLSLDEASFSNRKEDKLIFSLEVSLSDIE